MIGDVKDDKERWETPALRKPQLMREGLSKRYALPVFATNALSSVSYAPDQILLTLGLGGIVALSLIHISEPTRREWLSRMPSSA